MGLITLENAVFSLILSETGRVISLRLKATGEELAAMEEDVSLFRVTQNRPFNNEVKLAHPNKRTSWQTRSIVQEGDLLHVSFETVPVKANIRVTVNPAYILFTLEGFTVLEEDYGGLCMDLPPVAEFSLCRLPLKNRRNFGEWLNINWDDSACVSVVASSPYERIDSEVHGQNRILTADAVSGIRLENSSAAIIVSRPEDFLDAMSIFEKDLGLPNGAEARRNPLLNRSVYWSSSIDPSNVQEHLKWAKKSGFSMMLIYYKAFCKEGRGYSLNGDYDFNEKYPNGLEDLRSVVSQIKEAGMIPGFHFLQTHIGMESRYVTPRADRRLGKKARYTLARPYQDGDTELYIDEIPLTAARHERCRVLHFGQELFTYEDFTLQRPCKFTGVKRQAFGTLPEEHEVGQVGYLLDMSEYSATSCYVDQDTDLQDEIAEKLAAFYNVGFEFCYMDGSEGTNLPYEFHVPNSQYRVYQKLTPPPLFTEGAAKAHFSWHFQAGSNAFDIFPPKEFKEAIVRFPAAEAPQMRKEFTRLDFGWWGFWAPREEDDGIQADMYEFGTSIAAAWDCPVAIQANIERFAEHPRVDDILEVLRRWEDVRKRNLLTDSMRASLRDTAKEHTLIYNENGDYELLEIHPITAPAPITAFRAQYQGRTLVIYWNRRGESTLKLPLPAECFELRDEPNAEILELTECEEETLLPAGKKRYLLSALPADVLEEAFQNAEMLS